MGKHNGYEDGDKFWGIGNERETTIQILISLVLGLSAFLAFCVLRPRWPSLYAARKIRKDAAAYLPELPSSLFGWLLPLWRITDQQILASAGLDAYVFLTFFNMAKKFLFFTLTISLLIIKPVHDAYPEVPDNKTTNGTAVWIRDARQRLFHIPAHDHNGTSDGSGPDYTDFNNLDYLWMYIAFAYLFTGIAIWLIITETRKIIAVRQEFLGTQTTVTDRTIRLSGIPSHLQDEEKIKDFIERLDIGKVDSVMLCRDWKELDQAMAERMNILRRLEEAYTVHLGYRTVERNRETLPISQPSPPGPAVTGDLNEADADLIETETQPHVRPYARTRPKVRLRSGFFKLRHRKVDAIDHYEEELQKADERVRQLRTKEFKPTPLAFVTMDSVAACQMAIQAVLDPSPLQLIANQSPAPSDVVWSNTYLSRRSRMMRSWTITALIVLLTVFWSAIFVPIAALLQIETIAKVLPQFADLLEKHEIIQSLVKTQLPVLFTTLLMALVPYLYYWLSWCQGQLSQGEIELASISKNFFFTFFNFFIIFTVLGTATTFYKLFENFGNSIKDIPGIAYTLALSLARFLDFYVNFIILQGLGLFPFRLLEFGSVSLYSIYLIGAKTPRDYAELVQPPFFSYGYYLPSAILILIICMVYSVLRNSWRVILAGLIYFVFGHFVYKYQLLYAMDHREQSTGRAWVMICDRLFIGLVVFQLTTAGQLALKGAVPRSLLLVPLLIATVWISILFGKTYKPLMRFIALSSVKRGEQFSDNPSADNYSLTSSTDLAPERNVWADVDATQSRRNRESRYAQRADDVVTRFVNPNLVTPLDGVWILDKDASRSNGAAELVGEGEISI